MAELYPFPIPKSIKTEVLKQVGEACRPWGSLDEWWEGEDDPKMFGYFSCWRGRAFQLLTATKLIVERAEPAGAYKDDAEMAQWEGLKGTLCALELMLSQFSGLLEWARKTWQHDPNVRGALVSGRSEKDPDDSEEESDNVIHVQRPEPASPQTKGREF